MPNINVSTESLKDITKTLEELLQKIRSMTESVFSSTIKANDKTINLDDDYADMFKVTEVIYPGSIQNALKLFSGIIDDHEAFESAVHFDYEQMSDDNFNVVPTTIMNYFRHKFPILYEFTVLKKDVCIDINEILKLKGEILVLDNQSFGFLKNILIMQRNDVHEADKFLREIIVQSMVGNLKILLGID